MELTPMRYRTFLWPHNPHTYAITFRRPVAEHKIPFGNYCIQDLGLAGRVLEGEGEFVGEGAYDTFKELASLFYQGGPGLLVHPVWQTASAYFTELSLLQRPLPDYVSYRFAFAEDFAGYRAGLELLSGGTAAEDGGPAAQRTHQVIQGDTLWAIGERYGVALSELLAANPAIRNPNLIHPGDKVVIPG